MRRAPVRGLAARTLCGLLLAACTGQPLPLLAPLPANTALVGGLRVALLDSDLPALAETMRLAAGKVQAVAAEPWPVPAAGAQVAALAGNVAVEKAELAWVDAAHLRLSAHLQKPSLTLSVTPKDQAACPLSWQADGATVAVQAEVQSAPGGGIAIIAGAPLAVAWQGAGLSDTQSCFAALPAGAAQAVDQHVRAEILNDVGVHLGDALVSSLHAVFAPSLAQSGRVVAASTPASVEARFDVQFRDTDGHVAVHAGNLARAELAVAVDADRHPCAVDAPLTTAVIAPLAAPAPPSGQAFQRRALVLDGSVVQRLAWLAARAGALCARTAEALAAVPPGWAADILPQLDPWIEGPPASARFWPGSSPVTRLIDAADGPAIEWTLDEAVLEITARIADTELTVLRVTGGFRATLVPHLIGSHALGFRLAVVERLSTRQSSPLLGDFSTPSETALSALCAAALRGIFESHAVLPLLGLSPGPLPAGTVITRVERSGDALWVWLDGGNAP